MESIDLSGRVAVVTGAAQGIGAAVSTALARHGAAVAAVDNNQEALDKLHTNGGTSWPYLLDVTDARTVDAVIERIEHELGAIDILVNVAGVLRTGPFLDITDDDWTAVLEVNVGGVFRLCRSVGRRMATRRRGSIVTVASNAGKVPRMNMAAYSASKAAAAMLTKCLGLELAGSGIRCNVVSPGSTDTPMLRSMWDGEEAARATLNGSLSAYRVGVPLGKLATPDDIADAVRFLVSDLAGHITMHELCVDGGAALGG